MDPNSQAQDIVNSFNSQFIDLQRDLKVKILKCQIRELENKSQSSEEAEHKAMRCLASMNQLRQEAQGFLNGFSQKFGECINKARESGSGEKECVDEFRDSLSQQKGTVEQMYQKHLNIL